MDASCGVPRISSLHILDSMDEVLASIDLSLTQVLGLTQDVRADSLLVLDSLLNDYGLGVLLLMPLGVESQGSAIENPLLAVSKSVVRWIKLPVVIPLLLLTWGVVTMGLPVHRSGAGILSDKGATDWIEHLFGTLEALGWHTKLDVGVSMLRPIVLAAEALTQWLPRVGSVFILLDIIEFVGKTRERLSLDDLVDGI